MAGQVNKVRAAWKINSRVLWTVITCIVMLVVMQTSYFYYCKMKIGLSITFHRNNNAEDLFNTKCIGNGTLPITTQAATGMWTIHPIGRLGNLMGEYATLYSLAKLNGHQAAILPGMHNELSKIFKLRLPVIHQEVVDRIKWRNYGLHDWMSPEYNNIQGEYVKFGGYPCSWTFYHHIREEILQEFTFHDFIKEETNAYLTRTRGDRKNVTFVGVHVRRGDYVHVMPNAWKGVIADKKYLKKAMDYFRDKYEKPLFVVTSNGMDWCKENMNNSLGDIHFAGDGKEGSPGRDFALLAHCNHTIMTIGTFGFWAGYMVRGETIYLTNFTLPDSNFLRVFKYEAAFLPDWIGIPADLSPLLKKENPH